ncbi:MAG: signal peptide prediction [Burkholderiaceae bacterium]
MFLYLWVSPVTMLGLLAGLLACALGASVKRRHGVIEIAGNARTPLLRKLSRHFEAITLGHVILGRNHGSLNRCRSHEHVHVRQYERWGALMPVLYLLASAHAWASGKHFYWDNVFEIEARERAT